MVLLITPLILRLMHRSEETLLVVEDDADQQQKAQAQNVSEQLRDSGVDFELRQPVGVDPAAELLTAMDSPDAELLVIGIRHRSPVGKLLLGSVSQRLLLECLKPVLAVKPKRY